MAAGYTGELACVKTVKTLKGWIREQLASMPYPSGNVPIANVYNYVGTEKEVLLEQIPDMRMPNVVIWYAGSEWGDRPRRTANMHLIVNVSCIGNIQAWEDADASAIGYVEDIVDHFNRSIVPSSNANCRVESDDAIAVDDSISSYEVVLQIINQ